MTEVTSLQEQLGDGVAALGLTLSPEQTNQLLAYLELLDKWNRVYNLTAVREAERMVSHHLLDSLAVVPYMQIETARPHPDPDNAPSQSTKPASGQVAGYLPEGEGAKGGMHPHTVIDVGSGGGLPGIPLAIARPDLQVTLIDSIAKKTAFLQQAKAELALANVSVVTGRVEAHQNPAGYDIIISRAFSDLREFVSLTRHLLAPGGRWLAMKGLYPHEELAVLTDWVKVSADHALIVSGLEASRHLIVLEPVV